jgi:uncharacterized membrane protein YfcA
MTYIFKIDPVLATSYSLFVVGAAAAIGAFKNIKKSLVDFKVGGTFAIPAFISIYIMRQHLMPLIPNELSLGLISLTKDSLVMSVFAVVMLAASISMIRGRKESNSDQTEQNISLLMLQGLFVGCMTGFVGAGGGFLIIPGLVLFARMPMKKAVGTSLMIISINSLFGFSSDLIGGVNLDWFVLLVFTLMGAIGVLIGSYCSDRVSGAKLKPVFGWFVLIAGSLILLKELS